MKFSKRFKKIAATLFLLFLVLFQSAQAESNSQKLEEFYKAGKYSEALALVKRLITEVPNPLLLGWLPSDAGATPMLRLPEWPEIQRAYFERLDVECRKRQDVWHEIEVRSVKDQWARFQHTANPETPFPSELDMDNTRFLKTVVEERGWPLKSEVGELTAQSAWILLQHSPDKDFQAKMLPVLETLLSRKECLASNFALLYDRVKVHQGKPQRYGSQVQKVDGNWQPVEPLEDFSRLDEFRAQVELPPMSEYLRLISQMYDKPTPNSQGWFR